MKILITKLPWLIAASLLAILLVYGFWPEPIEVDLVTVQRGSLEVTVDDDGETRIREKYVVSAPVSGKLLRVQLHAGDAVEQGVTELAKIEPSDPVLLDARTQAEYEARLNAAEAGFQQAKTTLKRANEARELADHELNRATKLRQKNAVSAAQFDAAEHGQRIALADVRTAEAGVKVASFEVEQAKIAASRFDVSGDTEPLRTLSLVAPIDGRVLRVLLEDAGAVTATTPLLELGDPRDLELRIDVLSSDAVKIKSGDKVYIEHWGGGETLEGLVRIVEPSAYLKVSALGVEEKRVNVIADFVQPQSHANTLGDGFRIEARIVIASTSESSLFVQAGALFRKADSWCVYRVVDGLVDEVDVQIGETNGHSTEIRGGLSESDTLILHPTNAIRKGVRVMDNG